MPKHKKLHKQSSSNNLYSEKLRELVLQLQDQSKLTFDVQNMTYLQLYNRLSPEDTADLEKLAKSKQEDILKIIKEIEILIVDKDTLQSFLDGLMDNGKFEMKFEQSSIKKNISMTISTYGQDSNFRQLINKPIVFKEYLNNFVTIYNQEIKINTLTNYLQFLVATMILHKMSFIQDNDKPELYATAFAYKAVGFFTYLSQDEIRQIIYAGCQYSKDPQDKLQKVNYKNDWKEQITKVKFNSEETYELTGDSARISSDECHNLACQILEELKKQNLQKRPPQEKVEQAESFVQMIDKKDQEEEKEPRKDF